MFGSHSLHCPKWYFLINSRKYMVCRLMLQKCREKSEYISVLPLAIPNIFDVRFYPNNKDIFVDDNVLDPTYDP